MSLFPTVNDPGPGRFEGRAMRERRGWPEHAALLNHLRDDRILVPGGPRERGPQHRAMLVLRGVGASELRPRLGEDPWMRSGGLRSEDPFSWELRLVGLP